MFTTGSGHLSRHPRRILSLSARVGASSAAIIAAFVTATPSASSAGTSADLSASASALQAQIVSTGRQLHTLANEVAAASARLTTAQNALRNDQATLANLQTELAQATAALRVIALSAYMRDSGSSGFFLFAASPTEASESKEYEQFATGSESDAADRFLKDQQAVVASESQIGAQRASAAADYAALSHEYAALQSQAAKEQADLNAIRRRQAQLAAAPPATVNLSILAGNGGDFAEKLYRLRECESGDNYQDNTGNGYYGAYQFSMSTWQSLGYSGLPSDAPPATQDAAATQLVQKDGWGQWPACSAMMGLN